MNIPDIFLYNKLKKAIKENDLVFLTDLVDSGFDINEKDKNGETVLFWVIKELDLNSDSDLAYLKVLLDVYHADINIKNNDGNTPLHIIGYNDGIAKLLIEHGADVNAKGEFGATPLHVAVSEELCQTLIGYGADIHAKDNYGRTPLHYCSSNIAVMVLINPEDINVKDNSGKTPLLCYIEDQLEEMNYYSEGTDYIDIVFSTINDFISAGADINIPNNNGKTVLQIVQEYIDTNTDTEQVKRLKEFLVSHGAK